MADNIRVSGSVVRTVRVIHEEHSPPVVHYIPAQKDGDGAGSCGCLVLVIAFFIGSWIYNGVQKLCTKPSTEQAKTLTQKKEGPPPKWWKNEPLFRHLPRSGR